jgi:hypothetical protein
MKFFTCIMAICRILCRVRRFSSVSVISLMIQTYLHINAVLMWTNERSKGIVRKVGAIEYIGKHWPVRYF